MISTTTKILKQTLYIFFNIWKFLTSIALMQKHMWNCGCQPSHWLSSKILVGGKFVDLERDRTAAWSGRQRNCYKDVCTKLSSILIRVGERWSKLLTTPFLQRPKPQLVIHFLLYCSQPDTCTDDIKKIHQERTVKLVYIS